MKSLCRVRSNSPYVAVTGGIGSGKSYVCQLLESYYGIAVYDCDAVAKRLMKTSERLRMQLQQLVGEQVYIDGQLQKAVLAQFLLMSESNKQSLNSIVHPAVAEDFLHSGYHWLESAILFESGFDKRIDFGYVICVSAPLNVRIERIRSRDHISEDKARAWIAAQMSQREMEERSDAVILNDGHTDLLPQMAQVLSAMKAEG